MGIESKELPDCIIKTAAIIGGTILFFLFYNAEVIESLEKFWDFWKGYYSG